MLVCIMQEAGLPHGRRHHCQGTGMHAGELAALEEIVGMLINKQPQPLLRPIVTKAIAWLCDRAHQQACSQV